MKTIVALLVSSLFLFSGEDYIHLQAVGWVEKVVISDSLAIKASKNLKIKQLSLALLPIKDIKTEKNGNRYLKCYLINNSDTISSINRADATITELSSELLIKDKWVTFQIYKSATCGESYWTQKLDTKHSLCINFDWRYSEGIKLPFRLSYKHQSKMIKSNEIQVRIPATVVNYIKRQSLSDLK